MRSSKTRSNATPKGCRGAAPSADRRRQTVCCEWGGTSSGSFRSEEHTSELQSQSNLVCRLLLEKKKEVDEHRPRRGLSPVLLVVRGRSRDGWRARGPPSGRAAQLPSRCARW